MNIYLNECSFDNISEIEESLFWLFDSINRLSPHSIYTRLQTIKNWKDTFDDLFDKPSRTYMERIINRLEDCNPASSVFYYHHFTHQDFGLAVSENISHTSLAIAAEKILQNQLAVILNLPNSSYNQRSYLPILQSPYNSKEQDKLANIPCFDSAKKAQCFVFLHEKIKHQVTQDFESFAKAYQTHIDSFDFANWKPKQVKDNKLIENIAFPASNSLSIKKELSTWKIEKGSTEHNITEYNRLGGIVAELHGYTKNERLSSHYKYDIYEAGYGNNKLLLSIDVESGPFEVIESSGTHIGVYGYDGHYIKHYTEQKDIDTHSFKNIPTHLFLFK